jgi:hypothetical protein
MNKPPASLRFLLQPPTAREPAIRVKTTGWYTPLPDDHLRIGISRGVPRRFPAGFRMYRKLQPGPWFNSVSTLEYDRLYKAEVLALLDPAKVIADLEAIARGKIPVLCCYERAGSGLWCHRALAAQWLSDALVHQSAGVGHEVLSQDDHPMMPQELRRGC